MRSRVIFLIISFFMTGTLLIPATSSAVYQITPETIERDGAGFCQGILTWFFPNEGDFSQEDQEACQQAQRECEGGFAYLLTSRLQQDQGSDQCRGDEDGPWRCYEGYYRKTLTGVVLMVLNNMKQKCGW